MADGWNHRKVNLQVNNQTVIILNEHFKKDIYERKLSDIEWQELNSRRNTLMF